MDRAGCAAVILAAGLGTRFRSELAKVMHEVAGRTILRHVLEALRPLGLGQVVVVVGHQADEVAAEAQRAGMPGLVTALQEDQRGTGHAAAQALPALDPTITDVIVLPGDVPLISPEVVERLLEAGDAPAVMLTTELDDPTGYGRIVRDVGGNVTAIVEEADASDAEREIREVNPGMYRFRRELLADAVADLDEDNAQGEQYLTDVVAALVDGGEVVQAITVPPGHLRGCNDRVELAQAGQVLRRRILERHMRAGVTVVDPETTYVGADVEIGRDAVLLPGTLLEGATRVDERAVVGPYTRLVSATVGVASDIAQSVVIDAEIGSGVSVGPFAYIRPGTRVADDAKVGTFVELKNTRLDERAKVPHLSYVGDARIGAGANVGAGTITCNYDGFDKHETEIGAGAFIGSDTMLVAPVRIGDGAFTGAGSAITEDVPDGALAVERAEQRTVEGWATRRRDRAD